MKIVLLGPPGAGKGTQAKQICMNFGIPHISTGDMFRKNISEKTELGVKAKGYMDKGLLVPDELTISIVKDRLSEDDCKNGFLLDGFPRTVKQAEVFSSFLSEKIDAALLIQVPRESILDRMTGRRVCPVCGASYHIKFNPPKIENKCDKCSSTLVQRKDDNEETVKDRLDVYYEQTEPLASFYKSSGVLCTVDGTHDIDIVFNDILGALGKIKAL
jgi:adenylate kinase